MAGLDGTGNSEAGTIGVGDVYSDLCRRVDGSARSVSVNLLDLLNIREALIAWNGSRKDCSINGLSHYCESKENLS